MPRAVLDASAVLAVVLEEPGADVVVEALRSGAAMSSVNVAEVAARLDQDGWSESEVALVFESLGIALEDIASAKWIYQQAKERGIGVQLPF